MVILLVANILMKLWDTTISIYFCQVLVLRVLMFYDFVTG
jgi:hypothetical protein